MIAHKELETWLYYTGTIHLLILEINEGKPFNLQATDHPWLSLH